MRVLVIPEDFRKDQYILKPIVKAMCKALGKPQAKVVVLQDPLMGGVSIAMNTDTLKSVVARYRGMIDVFLLCVDRDGEETRRAKLNHVEKVLGEVLPHEKVFLAEHAWQELEVWLLAGMDLPSDWEWDTLRRDHHPKEHYFVPMAVKRQLQEEPGEGRKTLGQEAASRYDRIRQRCPEDVQQLENRLKHYFATH